MPKENYGLVYLSTALTFSLSFKLMYNPIKPYVE